MPQMHEYRDIVSLIPYGLPQFLDFEIPCGKKIRKAYAEQTVVVSEEEQVQKKNIYLREVFENDDYRLVDADGSFHEENDVYDVSTDKHLGPWLNKWVPIPFLRRSGENHPRNDGPRFLYGPINWARAYMTRVSSADDPNTFNWRAVLVFDMQVEEPQPNRDNPERKKHAALSPDDVTARAVCSLAWKERDNARFLEEGWVDAWLKTLWNNYFEIKEHRSERPRCRGEKKEENRLDYLATYLVYLALLQEITGGVSVSIVNLAGSQETASDEHAADIVDVDLILDIGNSRSTGILVENQLGRNTDLNDSYPLQLRDLSRPDLFYTDPFETRVEFSEANFGFDAYSRRSGRKRNAFTWASPVRTGPEASRLANMASNAEGTSGMTSPKRYLWDQGQASNLWYFNRTRTSDRERLVSTHPVCRVLNNNGIPLRCIQELQGQSDGKNRSYLANLFSATLEDWKEQVPLPAALPRFSRSSMMMFLFMELIQQALVTMNSPAQRYRRDYSDRPRRLRSIIFTVPPGMPFAEQRIYRRWAYAAVEVLWDVLGWKNFYIEPYMTGRTGRDYRLSPEIRNRWDEATCTQLVYLFNEITRNYQGDAHLFFEVMGRSGRQVPCEHDPSRKEKKPSLRIAAVDMGGGTTDLSITTYILANEKSATNRIWPKQEFRDGFNFGGDDVLKIIVSKVVCQAFVKVLIKEGVDNQVATRAIRDSFGRENNDIRVQNLRIQFVRQVAMPIAYKILSFYEQKEPYDTTGDIVISMRSLFHRAEDGSITSPNGPLQRNVVDFFNESLMACCGKPFDILDTDLSIRCKEIDGVITEYVRDKLNALGEIIHAYDCDLLLLSGRPSRWNAVVRQVFAMPPVAPDRIIPMHRYIVGPWYPFADTSGEIIDPKTTVVTGAILCTLAENSIEGFVFDSSRLKLKSTARYIGELNAQGELIREMVWFPNQNPDKAKGEDKDTRIIEFSAPITIGFRQLETPRWTAMRCWRMEFSSEEARRNAVGHTPYLVKVKFVRPSEEECSDDIPESKRDIKAKLDEPQITYSDDGSEAVRKRSMSEGSLEFLPVSGRPVRIFLRTLSTSEEDGSWMDTGVLFD